MEKAARVLLDKGVDTVLVKLGSKGSLLVTREQIIAMLGMPTPVHLLHMCMSTACVRGLMDCLLPAGDGTVSQPIVTAGKVLDTTGAGDCFTAAFAVATQEGQDVQAALQFAAAAAGICVAGRGAMPSLPGRADVDGLVVQQ